MNKPDIPYDYVCIEGNIGAGKTSFCKKMALQYNVSLILEQFADNPFLPLFYQNPERHAFTVELFFMTERYKQLQNSLQSIGMFHDFYLADYSFIKTQLFARKNLEEEEFKLFSMLYNIMQKNFPNPDLLVYFHRDVDILQQNIKSRGREIENSIKSDYLVQIQNSYFDYFRNILTYPILIIDIKEMDFMKNEQHYQVLIDLIAKKYLPGVHRITLSS